MQAKGQLYVAQSPHPFTASSFLHLLPTLDLCYISNDIQSDMFSTNDPIKIQNHQTHIKIYAGNMHGLKSSAAGVNQMMLDRNIGVYIGLNAWLQVKSVMVLRFHP